MTRAQMIDRIAELLDRWFRVGDAARNAYRIGTMYRMESPPNSEPFLSAWQCARAYADGMTPDQLRAAIEAAERTT